MEIHPRLNFDALNLAESKIILGSFPPWSLSKTIPKNSLVERSKKVERDQNNEIEYFYGSQRNLFWNWYKIFVDLNIDRANIESIISSLKSKEIGITDLIINCVRKDKSALDKHLTKRTFNYQFFKYPKEKETVKIICTSKGVMNEMLLSNNFFKLHPKLEINTQKSNLFQNHLISKISGELDLIRNPFYQLIEVESGGTIECIALPSPGSPYRRLVDFGLNSNDLNDYLNNYLKVGFDWFLSD